MKYRARLAKLAARLLPHDFPPFVVRIEGEDGTPDLVVSIPFRRYPHDATPTTLETAPCATAPDSPS